MFCTTSETEGEVGAGKMFKQPFQGDSSVVPALCCLFWYQSFGDVSHYVCSYYFYFGLGC